MMDIKVCLSSWSGRVWFNLPLDPDDVKERLQLSNLEGNFYVCDVENFSLIDVDEETSVEELNRIYYKMIQLPGWLIGGLWEAVAICGSLDEVVEAYDDGRFQFYEGVHDITELSHYLIDECGVLGDISDAYRLFIDYEAFEKDFGSRYTLFNVSGGLGVYSVHS